MPWGILIGAVRRYLRYHELAIHIGQLDEHVLFDIGCTRSELYAEAWERASCTTPRLPEIAAAHRKEARDTTRASARWCEDRA